MTSRAPSGTASEPTSYRFTEGDLPYEADSLRYRLRQVDADGSAHLTDPITVGRPVSGATLRAPTPNPVRQTGTVRYAVPNRQRLAIHLYDVLGRRVQTLDDGTRGAATPRGSMHPVFRAARTSCGLRPNTQPAPRRLR